MHEAKAWKHLLATYVPADNVFLLISLCLQPWLRHTNNYNYIYTAHQSLSRTLAQGVWLIYKWKWRVAFGKQVVCTCDFWCTRRHSSKWARVRSTDFRTLLREVLFCHVSPSAILWYQSGFTVFWRAMNFSTVSLMRPPLPHTDTVCWRQFLM